jgi:hypothetical protein
MSLGGQFSIPEPRLGVRNSCAGETSSLITLSGLIRPVKGIRLSYQQIFSLLA